jgi:hypothetical protein
MADAHLARVRDRIAHAILDFALRSWLHEWHADELRAHVTRACGPVAPGSPDRILRAMRQAGDLNYAVVSRRESRYRWLPLVPDAQLALPTPTQEVAA